ncbi:MAG: hypothetical protein U5K30_12310 [Acidimicrobiales bacterium]|nr:hypothetical protein [Acidimicrobiales bacterium]
MLDDGTYDALVFDAEASDHGGAGGVSVDLTILAGEYKGDVVSLHTADWSGDPMSLLGVPATITVTEGEPSVRFEP